MQKYSKPRQVQIAYFTGTGTTRRAAQIFAQKLTGQEISNCTYEIHRRKPYQYQSFDLLVLLYPVYAMNAPAPVYDFIQTLPEGRGTKAVVISVSGGGEISPNTASRLHCIRHLQKRGYYVVYEQMLVMPSNCLEETPKELNGLLLKALPAKIDCIVQDLVNGVKRRTNPAPLDRFVSFLGEAEKIGAKAFGRHIEADYSCNGCGLCAKTCPTGNIRMRDGHPRYNKKCTLCLKCIYDCPKQALKPKYGKFFLLKDGFSLKAMEQQMDHTPPIDPATYPYSKGFEGLKKYLSEYLK